jgi:hypothetical protein
LNHLETLDNVEMRRIDDWIRCVISSNHEYSSEAISEEMLWKRCIDLNNSVDSSVIACHVESGLKLFFMIYGADISRLLVEHPVESLDESGASLFWSGSKSKIPIAEIWPNFDNGYKIKCLRQFVIYFAILRAKTSGYDHQNSSVSKMLDLFESSNIIESIRSQVYLNYANESSNSKNIIASIVSNTRLLSKLNLTLKAEHFNKVFV